MRFISAVMKGADTNPRIHLRGREVPLRQLNTPQRFVRSSLQRFVFFFFSPLCQSVTVISRMLIKANYVETGRHNSFLIVTECCCCLQCLGNVAPLNQAPLIINSVSVVR